MPIVVDDKGGAIALMLVSLFLLGTWPALLTLLERRGRLPQHTYLDYSITNLLAAVVMALTLGQAGQSKPGMPKFFTQLAQIQDNWPSVLFAVAGGISLGFGNLVLQYAFAFAGLTVTSVVVSSLIVVTGTTMNYFLDERINHAAILFPGVGCFLIAALLGAAVHASNIKDDEKKLSMSDMVEPENGNSRDCDAIGHAKVGTAEIIIQVERGGQSRCLALTCC
ncbi:hypothetical protein HU200_057189 [Digitaria exilis]|uniref:Ureide permease n=1 Tax=Digitaria exilis TaxID=1010633 RepID=A0A835E351_9POAL|nr:hypothetical protein HU200_057189 [Digitaria exilis]